MDTFSICEEKINVIQIFNKYSYSIKTKNNTCKNNKKHSGKVRIKSLCGNIGSGKTTLIENLAEEFSKTGVNFEVIYEPIEEWEFYVSGMYSELDKAPKKRDMQKLSHYTTDLQHACFFHFLRTAGKINRKIEEYEKEKPETDFFFILERTILDTMFIFSEELKQYIGLEMYDLITKFSNQLLSRDIWKQVEYIYIRMDDVEILKNRIDNREKKRITKKISCDMETSNQENLPKTTLLLDEQIKKRTPSKEYVGILNERHNKVYTEHFFGKIGIPTKHLTVIDILKKSKNEIAQIVFQQIMNDIN